MDQVSALPSPLTGLQTVLSGNPIRRLGKPLAILEAEEGTLASPRPYGRERSGPRHSIRWFQPAISSLVGTMAKGELALHGAPRLGLEPMPESRWLRLQP